jgi:hypothetical protein
LARARAILALTYLPSMMVAIRQLGVCPDLAAPLMSEDGGGRREQYDVKTFQSMMRYKFRNEE